MPKIILEGEYRASDRTRKWRIVKTGQGRLVVESEGDTDAMGGIIWEQSSSMNTQSSVEKAVLETLVKKADL